MHVSGLRQNLRTVKAEIKKSVNAAIAVKYAVRRCADSI